MEISFNYLRLKFKIRESRRVKIWLKKCIAELGFVEGKVEFNFVGRSGIIRLNKEFLQHNYSTDIITFSYQEKEEEILAEIFICPEQVKRNARIYGSKFQEEMRRVLIHGILHCAGYHDLTEAEIKGMRDAEDLYLKSF